MSLVVNVKRDFVIRGFCKVTLKPAMTPLCILVANVMKNWLE